MAVVTVRETRSQNERRRRKRERERERERKKITSVERKKSHTDLGEWVQGDLIGRGGFGSVYRAYSVNKPSLNIAVKVAQVSDSDSGTNNLPALLAEAKLTSLFHDSPHIINSYGHQLRYNYPQQSFFFYLFLEFATGETLRDRSFKFGLSDSEIKDYTKSVLSGLHWIHSKGYVHCDIKAENILLVKSPLGDGFIAKVADFGLAKSDENEHSCQGTRMYMPPETLSSSIQGKPSDIWALGCTVLEMLTGELLSLNWVSDPVIPSHLSEDAKDFLAKCLHVNASKRFTAERLLTHSFLMSKETVQQVAQVHESPLKLPSYIPLDGYSSLEPQKSQEGSGLFLENMVVNTCNKCGRTRMVHKATNRCFFGPCLVPKVVHGFRGSNYKPQLGIC